MRKTITAFAATITGKIVLGTAIAAAGVGGAAATDNLPELPSASEKPEVVETAGAPDLPEQAQQGENEGQSEEGPETEGHEGDNQAFGSETAVAERPAFVNDYLDSVAAWLDCVHEATEFPDDELNVQDCDKLSGPENPGEGVGEGQPAEASEQGGDNADANASEGQDRADLGADNADNAGNAGNADETPAPAEQGEPQGGPETAEENRPAEAGAAGNRP